MSIDKLRNAKSIDEFVAEYDKILSEGEYEAVVEAIAESTENEELRMMARIAPAMAPDEVLLKVAREVWKTTEGKRDVADLLGAAEDSMCRMCRWGDFYGVVCCNAKRREADLAGGVDETYCGSVGRESLFIGGLCDFFEIDAGEEEEDEVH